MRLLLTCAGFPIWTWWRIWIDGSARIRFLKRMKRFVPIGLAGIFGGAIASAADYTVIVSKATLADPEWRAVAESLARKHQGEVVEFGRSPRELQPQWSGKPLPRWVCWVSRPQELGAVPVAEMHRLARGSDEDPYTDFRWGIVTGRNAAVAAKVAAEEKPLVIRKVGASTAFASECVDSGRWFSEFNAGEQWVKVAGSAVHQTKGAADSTASIVDFLNNESPDCFITSGHATEHDWQPGFRYRNGTFGHRDGALIGKALDGSEHRVDSQNPKVYLAVGNCLMGNIPATEDCMALAWMGSGGVRQMVGYTVPTWFGFGGWGVLDYFVEQPGRFNLQDAWLANQIALEWKLGQVAPALVSKNPAPGVVVGNGDAAGLLHDRDVTVFYGDPKWLATMAPGNLRWSETFDKNEADEFTWTIVPQAGAKTFAPVDENGSQRGGRPLVRFLPKRISKAVILEGAEWKPVIADDFALLPNPGPGKEWPATIVIRFKKSD